MHDATLLLLLDEVRRKTLLLLDGVPDQAARWAPPKLANHILWHAGHCYVLLEHLGIQALGEPMQLSDEWMGLFSWNSDPSTTPVDRWPPLTEVVTALASQHDRAQGLLAAQTAAMLDAPAAHRPDRSRRFCLTHALHDEACHSGEIWLLRKMVLHSR